MLNWKDNWEKIRRIIDNEEEDKIPDRIEQAQLNKSESEIFLQKLKDAVENVLKSEITRIPNTNKAYIPAKFAIYLSSETDKSLREDKRKFFEQGLSTIIFESAKEMAGTLELTSKKIAVEIRVNGILENDEVEVIAFSDDKQQTIENFQTQVKPKNLKFDGTIEDLKTIEDFETIEDFGTVFGILYRVEIWQAGKKLNEFPIIKRKNTIGRDDDEKVANLRLPTDNRKISREHAEIDFEQNEEIWVTAKHKNPTVVSGQVIRNGEKAKLGLDGEIQIYDFMLRLKFTK